MMMKRIQKYIRTYGLGIFLLTLVASCSSSRHATKGASTENLSGTAYVNELISRSSAWDALTAKMSLTLDPDGKKPTKVSGSLRMRRGEVIQLSITPMLGIEVARAEISPDGVLVMDRMNKRYVQVSFDELKEMTHTDLDFHILQSLFLNELFLPGKSALTARDASAFAVSPDSGAVIIDVKKTRRFAFRFRADTDGRLTKSRISLPDTPYGLDWQYDKFRPLEQGQFPGQMQVSFEGGKKPVTALFDFSRLSVNADWETHTTVPKKYEKVEWQEIVKQLTKKE